MSNILHLPTEIFEHILLSCDPVTTISTRRVSKQFDNLITTSPALRFYTTYGYHISSPPPASCKIFTPLILQIFSRFWSRLGPHLIETTDPLTGTPIIDWRFPDRSTLIPLLKSLHSEFLPAILSTQFLLPGFTFQKLEFRRSQSWSPLSYLKAEFDSIFVPWAHHPQYNTCAHLRIFVVLLMIAYQYSPDGSWSSAPNVIYPVKKDTKQWLAWAGFEIIYSEEGSEMIRHRETFRLPSYSPWQVELGRYLPECWAHWEEEASLSVRGPDGYTVLPPYQPSYEME